MSLKIIDRRNKALGGQYNHRTLSQITAIAWHYSGVARQNRSFITNHESWWRNGLGWTRGGYHYYIDADANIYWNYNHTTRSNGVGNNNTYLINICVEANSANNYSKEQEEARQELTLYLMGLLNISANNVKGHKEFPGQQTACPGYSIAQLNEYRKQLANGKTNVLKTQTSTVEKSITPKATGQRVHLPASASSWRVYKKNGPYTTGSEIASLSPSKFGGLSYDIVGAPVKDVVLINTRDFGVVGIYVAKSTGANITGSGAGSAKPQVPKTTGQTLHLPATAKTWRVYNANGPYTTKHSIHQLTPSAYGGLSYEIKGNPAPDVYLIDTGVKGRVAIYAGPGTGATISGAATKSSPKAAPKAAPKSIPKTTSRKKLHLPKTAKTWRVYRPNGPYTTGNEIHLLTPSAFGGITYDILEEKGNHVYIIQTGVKGRVAIYAGPETGAKIT